MKKIIIILAIIVALLVADVSYLNLRSPDQPYGATAGSLVPTQNNTYDVGISSLRWRDGWFTRNLTVGGNISASGGTLTLASLTTGMATVTGALSALSAAITGGLSSATHIIGTLNGVLKAVSGNVTQAIPNTDYLAYNATPAVGDIITWNGTNWVSLPGSTAGYVLATNGSATIPYYALASTQYKILTFTYNMTLATANVSYTGFGFRPSSLQIMACDTNTGSIGYSNSTKGMYSLYAMYSGTVIPTNSSIIYLRESDPNIQVATLASYDTDGFTLTWTKTGSPTGIATIIVFAFK